MKTTNKILILFLSLLMLLTSCSSAMDEYISMVNENNITACYIGKENNLFDNIKRYYDLSTTDFPQRNDVDNFVFTIVDVGNKTDELSVDFLNKIYNSLEWNCYSYVGFFNFDHSLKFLSGSKFLDEDSEFTSIADMLCFSNYGGSFIRDNQVIFVSNSELDYDYCFRNTFLSLIWDMQKDLREM